MKEKKVPQRKCMGCMEMKPKRELVRVVKTKIGENGEYEISLDLTGKKNGRGAYVCPNASCLKAARKAKRFERALDAAISDEIFDKMEGQLKDD